MFGLGFSEIITLVLVIIILINPKELPQIVRKLGKVYAGVMKQINGIRNTYDRFETELKTSTEFDITGKSSAGNNNAQDNLKGENK